MKGNKLVVEAPNLLLLLVVHGLDAGVHLSFRGSVGSRHLDSCDAPHTPSLAVIPGQIHFGVQDNREKAEELIWVQGPFEYEQLLRSGGQRCSPCRSLLDTLGDMVEVQVEVRRLNQTEIREEAKRLPELLFLKSPHWTLPLYHIQKLTQNGLTT